MTYKIVTNNTNKVICHYNICSTEEPLEQNLHLYPFVIISIIKSKSDSPIPQVTTYSHNNDTLSNIPNTETSSTHPDPSIHIINSSDLVGRTFFIDIQEDGQRHRSRIFKLIDDYDNILLKDTKRIKFLYFINNNQ